MNISLVKVQRVDVSMEDANATAASGLRLGHADPRQEDRSVFQPLAHALNAVPPPGLVVLAILSIQVGAALAIQLFSAIGPLGTVFCRVGLSAIIFLILIRPKMDNSMVKFGHLLLLYGFTLAAMNWCFYEAIARIPLGIAVTIEFMGPLSVAIATSRRRIDLLWVTIALLGLVMLAPDVGSGLDHMGIAFAAIAAVGWAVFIVLSKRVGQALPGNTGLAYGMVIATLFLLPLGVGPAIPVLFDFRLLLGVVAVAVLSTTIPFFLEFEALRRLPARTYSILVTLEPAIAALVAAILLGEALGAGAVFAIACVTLAAIGATLFRDRYSP